MLIVLREAVGQKIRPTAAEKEAHHGPALQQFLEWPYLENQC